MWWNWHNLNYEVIHADIKLELKNIKFMILYSCMCVCTIIHTCFLTIKCDD